MSTVRIQVRRGLSTEWTSVDPILAAGEMGVESDTNLFKFGNGSDSWTDLAYANNSDVAITEISQDAINSALSVGDGLAKTYNDGDNTISIAVDSSYFNELAQDAIGGNVGTGLIYTDSTGEIKVDTNTIQARVANISDTEIGYLNGVNSSIQTQIDAKAPISAPTFTGEVNAQDLVLSGNLTVNGTNTILNTDSLQVEDNEITLNSNVNDTPALNAYVKVRRGTSADVYIAWNEANDRWEISSDGTTTEPIASTVYVNSAVSTHSDDVTSVHGIADTSLLATKTYADDAVNTHSSDSTDIHGIADTAALATKTYADNAVSTHVSDSTNIHGIANTADLATKTYADDAVSTHNSDSTNVHGIADTSVLATTSDISTHNLDTTNVHGISDTSALATTSDISAHSSDTTGVHGIADTSELALKSDVSTHASDSTSVHGIADTSLLAVQLDVTNAVDGHNSDTTSVHGIADTSLLATKSYADDAASDAQTAAETFATNSINALSTTDIEEGTSLYFTDERAQDAVGNNVGAGLVYNDTAGAIGVNSGEMINKVMDAVSGNSYGIIGNSAYLNTVDTNGYHKEIELDIAAVESQLETDGFAKLAGPTFTGTATTNNLVVDGDFTVNGTNFAASATSITIEDNLVQISHNNPANTVDLGLVVAYNDGASKHAGIARDVSESKWKLFKDVSTEPTTTVAFGEGSLDDLQVAGFEAATATIGDVSNTELQYLNGVTSAIQTQIDTKAPTSAPTFTGLTTVSSSGIAFSDKTQTKAGVPSRTPIASTISSSTTLASGLQDNMVPLSGAVTITIGDASNGNYEIGESVDFFQISGTGALFAKSGSVNLMYTPGLSLRTTYSSATAQKITSTDWLIYGDLKA